MRLSNLFMSAIIVLAAVMCSTPDLDAQGRDGQGQGGRQGRAGQGQGQGRAGQGQGRGQQGRGQQGRGGGFGSSRGGGTTLLGLCAIEGVQKEVDLVDEQKADLDKLRAAQREASASRARTRTSGRTSTFDREAYEKASDEEKRKIREDAQAARNTPEAIKKREEESAKRAEESAKRQKEEDGKVAEILLPPQLARVKEIRIQLLGLRALEDKEVIASLKITTAQQKQIPEIREKAQEASNTAREETFAKFRGASAEERRELIEQLRSPEASTKRAEETAKREKDTEKKILGVLTAKQNTEFTALKGEPFKMPERTRGSRTRGTQGRGTQGRGTQGRGNGDAPPTRGTQGRGGATPTRGTQGRDNPAPEPKKDDN